MKFWVKTFGWAVVSGFLILGGQLVGGSEWWPAVVATTMAVALKTPFYAVYEWAFHLVWPGEQPKAEPLEHLS